MQALASIALLAGLAACGEKKEDLLATIPQPLLPFTVALDRLPSADHAPIFTALGTAEYRDVGLDVKPVAPSGSFDPLNRVASGDADIAIASEPDVLLARQSGKKVVAVGALVQEPLTSLISLPKSGVRGPRDLSGKTVGTQGSPLQKAYLETILRDARVDPGRVSTRPYSSGLGSALTSGQVDATLGSFWNLEGVRLAMDQANPTVMAVDKGGVPTYAELVLVAYESRLKEDPGPVRDFVAATARGANAAEADPALAAQALLEANSRLDAGFLTRSLRATLPTFFPRQSGRPWGFLDAIQWQTFGAWMAEEELLPRRPDISQAMTNRYLAGEEEETS